MTFKAPSSFLRSPFLWAVAISLGAAAGLAQTDPLALVLDPIDDEETLARLGGDEALAQAFAAGAAPVHFLVAAASETPEAHLQVLAEQATSDDPDRSVWAAESAHTIAAALRPDDLAARESSVDRAAVNAWRAVAGAPVRPDVHELAEAIIARLDELAPPAE